MPGANRTSPRRGNPQNARRPKFCPAYQARQPWCIMRARRSQPWRAALRNQVGQRVLHDILCEALPPAERESVPALYRLGWLLAEYGRNGRKDEKAALETLRRALGKAPDDPDSNTETGVILMREGDAAQARPYFERALHADPTQTAAARGMATIFTQQKLPEAARARQVAEALEKREAAMRETRGRYLAHPEDTGNVLKLAELEARNGNRNDAFDLITHTLQADPNNAAALNLLHRLTSTIQK